MGKTSQVGDPELRDAPDEQGATDGTEGADGRETQNGHASDLNGSATSASVPDAPADIAASRIVSIRPTLAASRTGLPPGPRMPAVMQQLAFWNKREQFLEDCRARYGKRFTLRLRLPSLPFVVLSEPDDIKGMFLAPPDAVYAGDGSAELEKYFGPTGLTFMEEDEHLTRRKLINKSTHGEAVKRMTSSMVELVEREVATWPQDQFMEMYPLVHRLAVKAMRLVSFGPVEDRRLDELVDVHLDMMRFGNSLLSFTLLHDLPPTAVKALTAIRPLGFKRFFELRDRANALIRDVVEDRRREGVDEDAIDLVSVLLSTPHEDGTPLSWIEVRDEVVTTFVAGSESTAATLAFGIERLAHDDRVRQKLVDELEAGDDDAYRTAVFQEILRMKPTVPIIPRQVMKPVEINGVLYRPGVRLFGAPYLTHTDPDIYPDPYAFKPERFLENGPGTYTWYPFGGGRRRCLGKTVAEHEIKFVLREVLSRYDLRPERPDLEPIRPRTVVYVPGRGCRVALSNRSRKSAPTPAPA